MKLANRLHRWLRHGEGFVPRTSRAARRELARRDARKRHGSIESFLESIASEARSSDIPIPDRQGAAAAVIHLSTYPVHPRSQGGQIRTFYLAEALARRDSGRTHEILSFTNDPELAGVYPLGPNLTEHVTLLSESHDRRETQIRLVTGDVSVTDIALGILWRHVAAESPDVFSHVGGCDIVVAAQPYLLDVWSELAPGSSLIYDAHNDETAMKAAMFPNNEAGRWLANNVALIEAQATERASLVTATTHDDLASLRSRCTIERGAVIPNGVDTTVIRFTPPAERLSHRVALAARCGIHNPKTIALFVGSAHQPNIDAAKLITQIAPALPDVNFLMVGAHSDRLGRTIPSNVIAAGAVDEATFELALAGSDIALNPMLSGGGSNLKLLSYLASGLPVVATAIGARGIDSVAAGIHVVKPDDLAAGIEDLVGHADGGDAMERRRYVETQREWTTLGATFADLVFQPHFGDQR